METRSFAREGKIRSEGADIFYRQYGGGAKDLVLLHGNGEDHTKFYEVLPALVKKYRVTVLDSRGHGKSSAGLSLGESLTLTRMARDLYGVMNALGIKKPSIVGFSDGGNIALYFSLLFPERAEKLVLAGANLFPAGLKAGFLLPARAAYALGAPFAPFFETLRHTRALLSLMVNEPNLAPGDLKNILVPALVLAGEKDVVKEEHTRLIASSLPKARLLILKGAGHDLFIEKPDEAAAAILAFLEEK